MQFALNEDQAAFFSVLQQMSGSPDGEFHNAPDWGRYEWGAALDATLEENGFFDAAAEETLGTVTAAAMVYDLAHLPVTVECAASSLLRPLFAPDLPRPFAVMLGEKAQAIRFLPVARTLLKIGATGVWAATLPEGVVTPVSSQYAYPMGSVDPKQLDWAPLDCDVTAVETAWKVAIAAELTGVLKGGLDSVLEHVKDRKQFGRPLGSFQAVQHRLATASVQIEGARWLTLKAAQSLTVADAATALGQAQAIATKINYDLHQFMGAMGLTLEHPLHRWTYRARLLRSEFGGATGNFQALADQRWGTA